ncbi:MAG: dihydrofolate reductase [Gammaproteobacteria bacterium]|nr:dihydrofolate reductase [Gammaproteobacteria bacterium]
MRKIITTTFVTLDGVMQAPGGPDEDREGGFEHGGWLFGFGNWDEVMSGTMDGFMRLPFELLLGRRTYDIFSSYWPTATTDQNVAQPFNRTRKYVVSNGQPQLTWHNSTLVTGDVVSEIRKLKQMDTPDLWVHGSSKLIQTLLANGLIDVMHLWIFSVTLGVGKRLFAEGTRPERFKLVDSKVAASGVIIASYEPAGAIKTGSFV